MRCWRVACGAGASHAVLAVRGMKPSANKARSRPHARKASRESAKRLGPQQASPTAELEPRRNRGGRSTTEVLSSS